MLWKKTLMSRTQWIHWEKVFKSFSINNIDNEAAKLWLNCCKSSKKGKRVVINMLKLDTMNIWICHLISHLFHLQKQIFSFLLTILLLSKAFFRNSWIIEVLLISWLKRTIREHTGRTQVKTFAFFYSWYPLIHYRIHNRIVDMSYSAHRGKTYTCVNSNMMLYNNCWWEESENILYMCFDGIR